MLATLLTSYSLSKFGGGLGTFEQLIKGHEIEKLHAHDGWVKIIQEVLPYPYSNSLFFILVDGH